MKAIKKILFILIASLIVLTTIAFATSTQLGLTGNNEIKTGQTEKINIVLESSDDFVGVINGTIEYNDYISNINIEAKNGWLVTYNKENGTIYALKAEGAKSEQIAEITYTIKENVTGNAKIAVKDITFSTITYQTISVTDVSKEVQIIVENNNTTNNVINNFQNGTNINENISPDDMFPNTGILSYLSIMIIAILVCSAVICVIKYKEYRKL